MLNLEIGDHIRPALFLHRPAPEWLRFTYLVQDDDHDGDGISVKADAFELVAGSRIESQNGDLVSLDLSEHAFENDDFYKVRAHDPEPKPLDCTVQRREALQFNRSVVEEWDGTYSIPSGYSG